MLVEQLSVFVENKPGRILKLAEALKDNNINIITLSIADTKDFGIIRGITDNNKKALQVLRDAGFTAGITKLIGVEVGDKPGGMLNILNMFNDNNISIEYLYSFTSHVEGKAVILLRVEDVDNAIKMLEKNNIKIINESDIYKR